MEIKNRLTNKNTKVGRVSADGLRGQKDARNFLSGHVSESKYSHNNTFSNLKN